jgi:Domain of unknown function (DUF5916)/Carbohydrate family 9 binding domain-like
MELLVKKGFIDLFLLFTLMRLVLNNIIQFVLLLFFSVGSGLYLQAQTAGLENQNQFKVHIHKTNAGIKIDGELNEPAWDNAEKATNFSNWSPTDEGYPKRQTEFRLTYNDQNLYIGVILYDTSYYVIKTLKRDAEVGQSDVLGLVLDPMNQHTNGYTFLVNAFNVQAEDVITGGGTSDVDLSWDNKWISATTLHKNYWICEIAIPFKTLRYPSGKTVWGFNIGRGDLKNNEYSMWAKMPVVKLFTDLGFTGLLLWDAPPPVVGANISFIPYGKSSFTQDRENSQPWKVKLNAGFDVKAAVLKSTSLDATINPDFSQVEVDQQVTNLTRFNIFFPEKRTFFLENADLFTNFGAPPIRPFYSRTIGLDHDGNPIPIIGGARLSGNVSEKLRIGVMNIQTQRKNDFAAQNYSAVSFNETIFKRSVIKGYFLNRQGFSNDKEKQEHPLDAFGRNAGMQFNYSDSKGLWTGQASYHLSFKPGISGQNTYYQLVHFYNGRKFSSFMAWDVVGTNYYTDMGFVQRIDNYDVAKDSLFRQGFKLLSHSNSYTIFPKKGNISTHVFQINNSLVWNPDGSFNERNNEFDYTINFKNTSLIKTSFISQQQNLNYSVKFVNDSLAKPLPPGKYAFNSGGIKFNTDTRKLFNVLAGFQVGQFYNGDIQQYITNLNFRTQPWGNFSLNFEYDKLHFPANYGTADLFLIASRVEVCFSTSLFWTTFIQYNTQFNNVNINSRFQWRFKPMSDIYLVYSDNYFTAPLLKNKNRGVILKMNWWLNL